MTNIYEYFNNLYGNATTGEEWEAIRDQERALFKKADGDEEGDFLRDWAKERNVDLNAVGPHNTTWLQYWAWDWEED